MDERNPAQRPELLLCQRGDERAAPAQRKEGSGLWLDREPTSFAHRTNFLMVYGMKKEPAVIRRSGHRKTNVFRWRGPAF